NNCFYKIVAAVAECTFVVLTFPLRRANNGYLYHTFTTAPDTLTPNGWMSLGGQSIPFANDPVASWGSDCNMDAFAVAANPNQPFSYACFIIDNMYEISFLSLIVISVLPLE